MSATSIRELLESDHERLAALLDASCRPTRIVAAPFWSFRSGLLRHIAMEEKILLPTIKQSRGGTPHPVARQMKLDHSALAALLVPSPTVELVARLRALLEVHDAMEEGEEGVYALCDRVAGERRGALLDALRDVPPVKVAAYQDGPRATASIERLLRAAGRA